MPSPVLPKLVGQRVKRREDPRLIQGRATYVDDIKVAGMQHLAFKRSDIAHGRIRSIDVSAALAMDGVEAVFTGAQIAELVPPMPVGTPWPSPEHRAVAVDTVRYAGEPVAVVVARDRYVARDAADAIVVSYDPLPAVVDPELAMTGQPAVIHPGFANNLALAGVPGGTGVSGNVVDDSAIDKAFADADVVISQRMVNHRLVPNAIEPRGVVAHFEPGKGTMTIWSSTQNPHVLRSIIAAMNGLGQDQVRAIAPEVGGGFGAKINVYGEDFVAAAISKQLGMPIKWIEDRSEAFVATSHGRDIIGYVELAAMRDGTVLGIEAAPHRGHRRVQLALHGDDSDADDVDGQRHLRHPGDSRDRHRGLHQQDADRCVPRGRAARSDLLRRARDGHARARAEDGSGRRAPQELHQARPVPLRHADGRGVRLGRLREGARPRAEERGLGSAEEGPRRGEEGRTARRARTRHVCGSVRPRAVGDSPDRRLGALAGDDRARRPHQRDDRRVASRPGQRDDVRADARRPVRRADRAHHDPSRRHGHREAGHRHLRQPIAGGRRRGAAPGRRQGEDQDGEVRRRDARGARGRSRLRERPRLREGRAGVRQVVRRGRRLRVRPGAAAAGSRAGLERRGVLRAQATIRTPSAATSRCSRWIAKPASRRS